MGVLAPQDKGDALRACESKQVTKSGQPRLSGSGPSPGPTQSPQNSSRDPIPQAGGSLGRAAHLSLNKLLPPTGQETRSAFPGPAQKQGTRNNSLWASVNPSGSGHKAALLVVLGVSRMGSHHLGAAAGMWDLHMQL